MELAQNLEWYCHYIFEPWFPTLLYGVFWRYQSHKQWKLEREILTKQVSRKIKGRKIQLVVMSDPNSNTNIISNLDTSLARSMIFPVMWLRFSWPFSTPAWLEKITIFQPSLWSCCNFVFTSGNSHFQSERTEGYFDWLFGTIRVPSKSKLAIFVLPFQQDSNTRYCHKLKPQWSQWRILPWFQENS